MLRQGLYTIPSGAGFLKDLAVGLMDMAGGNQAALTQMRVILPTRRAGRELRDAFLKLSGDKPILLPRLQAIGDVDAEEVDLYLSGFGEIEQEIPPAISPLERRFLLSSLICRRDETMGIDTALSLADALAQLIDTVYTEDLDFSNLGHIVPDDLSQHWQQTLSFLEIVTTNWPQILAERSQIDPADRRNRLLKSLAHLWRTHPPETPVIAAGSTGSIPSAGELLKVIAGLPQGAVILPGLDMTLDNESWDKITDTHPQATLRNFLNRVEKTRADVKLWPESKDKILPRANMVQAMMRPAETFADQELYSRESDTSHLHLVEAATAREEAAAIAIALREVLDTPQKTACFVTPDRTLARRVTTALHRWGIAVDDSAGGVLSATPMAIFMASALRVIEEDFAPLPLLDFLKQDYQRFLKPEDIALLERDILRGSRPAPGLKGLEKRAIIRKQPDAVHSVLSAIWQGFAPFLEGNFNAQNMPIADITKALLEVAENFAGTTKEKAQDFLWSRPESESMSAFITSVMEYSPLMPSLSIGVFASVFRTLLKTEKYRSADEPHRRILILGQLESRLVQRDVMILGGLNEGTWPRDTGHDPWMSRPMRRNFGLPSPERAIGLAAHDFAEHISAPHVIITRSLKSDGTDTVPARWVQKLRTLLKAKNREAEILNGGQTYLNWSRSMDEPSCGRPEIASIPSPCPPQDVRPQTLSATWIEKWMKNPYRLYAEKILRLRNIDMLDMDKIHADRGTFVHDVLLEFVKTYDGAELPENARDCILDIARKKMDEFETISLQWQYWWPRFERLIDWFLEQEISWRKEAMPWIQETTGSYEVYKNPVSGRSFTVTAKADRIDRIKTGGCSILDYKTGTPPPQYAVKNGTAPQLPVEALILSKGGYRGTPETPQQMEYWKFSGSYVSPGERKPVNLPMPEVLDAASEGLEKLVTKFEDPQTPYMAKALFGRLYDDDKAYAHLARMSEWSSGDAEDDAIPDTENGGGVV